MLSLAPLLRSTRLAELETKGRRKISARKEYAEINRIRRAFERKLESRLGRMFVSEFRSLAESYESTMAEPDMTRLGRQLESILLPHYREVIKAFGQRVLDNLEIKFDFDRYVSQYVTERGSRNIVGIDSYLRERVRRRILRGTEAGLSVREIGKSITELGQDFSKKRGAVIARTETHSASSWANHQVHKEFMPTTSVKQWVSTADARTRSHHANMNGVEVGIDEEFVVITDGVPIQMRYAGDYKGGPRNVINCRCTVLYIDKTPDEETVVVDPQPSSPRRESPEPWVFREAIKPFFQIGAMKLRDVFGLGLRSPDDLLDRNTLDSRMMRFGEHWDEIRPDRLNLSQSESIVPFFYTTGRFRQINMFFRGWFKGDQTVSIDGDVVEINAASKAEALGFRSEMKKTFEKLPAYRGEVHRGVSSQVESRLREFGIEEVGSTYRAEAFLSCSNERGASFAGSKRLIFIINSKTGRHIEDISNYKHEKEVLFLPGTEFRVTKIERDVGRDNKTFVYMDEIGDELKAVNNNPVLIGGDKIISYSRRFLAKMASQDELVSVNNRLILLG